MSPWDWERKTIHIAVMDRLVSGHRRDLIKPLEETQKALWALKGPSKGFMKPFKRPLGIPFLDGKTKMTLGKKALSDSQSVRPLSEIGNVFESMMYPRMLTVRHISLIRMPWRLAAGPRDRNNTSMRT